MGVVWLMISLVEPTCRHRAPGDLKTTSPRLARQSALTWDKPTSTPFSRVTSECLIIPAIPNARVKLYWKCITQQVQCISCVCISNRGCAVGTIWGGAIKHMWASLIRRLGYQQTHKATGNQIPQLLHIFEPTKRNKVCSHPAGLPTGWVGLSLIADSDATHFRSAFCTLDVGALGANSRPTTKGTAQAPATFRAWVTLRPRAAVICLSASTRAATVVSGELTWLIS